MLAASPPGLKCALLAIAAAWLALAAPPADAVEIHAHRGAPLERGEPVAPENSLSALRRVAERWRPDYVELDVKFTADGVPVNFHDPTLDRTTTCSGRIDATTLSELRECKLDSLGTGERGSGTMRPIATPTETVPTLEEMLDTARELDVKLNVEIKNTPIDADFVADPPAIVDPIIDLIHAKGMLDRDHVFIQSFWPLDLDRAAQRVATLVPDPARRPPLFFLSLGPLNEGSAAFTALRGYDGLAPQWPTTPIAVGLAQAAGLQVVPWTINEADQMQAALDAGVDGIITDDVDLLSGVMGRGGPFAAETPRRGRAVFRLRTGSRGSIRVWRPRLKRRAALSCVRGGPLRMRLSGHRTRFVERVEVRLLRGARRQETGRLLASSDARPYDLRARVGSLPRRRLVRIEARATLDDGTVEVFRRRVRRC